MEKLNSKIKDHLKKYATSSPEYEAKILHYLNKNKNEIVFLRDIMEYYNSKSSTFYNSLYRLALTDQIGFVDRRFHIFNAHPKLSKISKRYRTACWHKCFDSSPVIPIRAQYVIYKSSKEIQPSLFGDDLETLSTQDLDKLIARAQTEKMNRMLEDRYLGGIAHITDPIKEVLKSYGVADPVALVHASAESCFLTLTATKSMPVKITYRPIGVSHCETVDVEHITLHHAPVVSTINDAYKRLNND